MKAAPPPPLFGHTNVPNMDNEEEIVLSPNLKSYLQRKVTFSTSSRKGNYAKDAVCSPSNQLAACAASPPFSPSYLHLGEDDGLLHSILFSAKKKRRTNKQRRAATTARATRNNHGARGPVGSPEEKDEEDIMNLFSPGCIQEFDIDEAAPSSQQELEADENNYHHDETMTLDSVDRIVRGDFIKRGNYQNYKAEFGPVEIAAGARSAQVAAAVIASPTNTTSAAELQQTGTTTDDATATIIVKTPKYSTPHCNDNKTNTRQINNDDEEEEYFYTPLQELVSYSSSPYCYDSSSPHSNHYHQLAAMSTTAAITSPPLLVSNVDTKTTTTEADYPYHYYHQGLSSTYHYDDEKNNNVIGGGSGSLSSLLAPVREEDEGEEEEQDYNNDEKRDEFMMTTNTTSTTPPFVTPKQYHVESVERTFGQGGGGGGAKSRWVNDEGSDNDEFFSPLVGQCRRRHHENEEILKMTPNEYQYHEQNLQQQQHRITLEHESYNNATKEEKLKDDNEMDVEDHYHQQHRHQEQLQQGHAIVTYPPLLTSPKYSEMRHELQQMLVEVKGLTPHKKVVAMDDVFASNIGTGDKKEDDVVEATMTNIATTTAAAASSSSNSNNNNTLSSPSSPSTTTYNSIIYSHSSTTPNSHRHLHSSSVSSLPPDALTVDFVRKCDCLDTLRSILSLLSSDDHNVRGKKQLRYPSLVRYVEKRMKMVAAAASDDCDDELEHEYRRVEHAHFSRESSNQGRERVPPPLDTISVAHSPREEDVEDVESNEWSIHHHLHQRQITPENQSTEEKSESMMTHDTSLDMNLSESLDDESFYWKQHGGEQEELVPHAKAAEDDEHASLETSKNQQEDNVAAVAESKVPQEEDSDPSTQHNRYSDLQEELVSSLSAHAQLTEKVELLVKEHAIVKDELTSKLNQAREQLYHHQIDASTEKDEYKKHVNELVQVNQTLSREMCSLKGRLEAVNKKVVDAANQAEFQLDEAKLIHSKLLKDNDTLSKELVEVRLARDKAAEQVVKLRKLLDDQMASVGTNNDTATKRLQKGLDAANFANQALANALAISEKDLSEALNEKKQSVRECNSLRERIVELEDKSSWLSSKLNEMNRELKSSHAYIDKLYADIQCNNSPSKEIRSEFERRELQWLELEHHYTRRIQDLESQIIVCQPEGSNFSMADYVRECRKHQSELAQKQQLVEELKFTVSSLKQQIIEMMRRRPSPRNGVTTSMVKGKSMFAARNYVENIQNESNMRNDENKAPPSEDRVGSVSGDMGRKKLSRMSSLKAVGGRKGLSEQLRRARGVVADE